MNLADCLRGRATFPQEAAIKTGGFDRGVDNVDIQGHCAPGPDGRYIFGGRGVFTGEGKPVGVFDRNSLYAIPAAEGGTFHLNLNLGTGA